MAGDEAYADTPYNQNKTMTIMVNEWEVERAFGGGVTTEVTLRSIRIFPSRHCCQCDRYHNTITHYTN